MQTTMTAQPPIVEPLTERSATAIRDRTMQAVVCARYGSPDVLQVRELATPTPGADEVLIRVRASAVTRADTMMRRGTPWYGRLFLGLLKPKHPIPGTGLAGDVVAIGEAVTNFKIGDAVFGESVFGQGSNADYVCVPQDGVLAVKPGNITYAQAAPICDGPLTALSFLQHLADLKPAQKVLIIGASGSIGSAAVQLARHLKADVTGVCSTANLALVNSLGADKTIDYTKEDFANSDQTYDVIFDTVGISSFGLCKRSLTPHGIYLSPILGLPLLFQMLTSAVVAGKRAKFSATGARPAAALRIHLKALQALFSAGHMRSVMDRQYRLTQIVQAHEYVDTGHKTGNVVIVADNDHSSQTESQH